MNNALKVTIQVAVLIGFVYLLGALMGLTQGYSASGPGWSVRVGKNGRGRCRCHRRRRPRSAAWVQTPMIAELIPTNGGDLIPAGVPRVGV